MGQMKFHKRVKV